jgi:8-oxo-dGTP diphosphatase
MFTYKYPRAALTVDALVYYIENGHANILLIKRGQEPFKNKWALPGGFINIDETLETACKRELQEETGLELKSMQQFRVYDSVTRDPRGRTISVVFVAELAKDQLVKGADDAAMADWFNVNQLPPLAFDHQEIISDFISLNIK